jgi:hypothetical protein
MKMNMNGVLECWSIGELEKNAQFAIHYSFAPSLDRPISVPC